MTLDDLRLMRNATVTLADTARLLDIDERTVSRGCAEGQLPHIRIGRRLLILREPLIALLEGRNASEAGVATPAIANTADPAAARREDPRERTAHLRPTA